VRAADEDDEDGELNGAPDKLGPRPERERRELDDSSRAGVRDLADDPEEREAAEVGVEEGATEPRGQGRGDPRSIRARTT
jgi:hypothetical protein